jgi:hypothetical protein
MSLIDLIRKKQHSTRKTIEVQEWSAEDEAPFIVYFGKFLAHDLDRLQRKHPGFINNVTIAGMVDMIIMKAQDRDGNMLFTLEDKPTLMREPVEVITRIAGEMMTANSFEDHEKN